MATRTSTKSGDWSSAGTWDTGVPADGDDVVIASGHEVVFDVDQSAFSTGVKITITGTLTHTTAAGSYCLYIKTGASVVGAGTWNVGTSATPIPFSSKHLITGAAGWYVDGVLGLTMNVYGAEPTYTTIKLSGDEAIGQTELSVDTDVTTDIWAAGDIIRIDDINKAKETEERIIAASGITASTITITAGLTAAKSTGAVVSLITRNIRIIAVGTGSYTIYRVGTGSVTKLTVAGGMWYGVNKGMFNTCPYLVVSGGTISGNGDGITGCSNSVVSGGTFNGNNYDIANTTGNLFGVELTAAIEHYQYTNITNGWHSLQSDNHDAVEGAVKAWCKGGVVTSQTAIKPDGYTQACAHALESATYPAFWYKKFTVPAGQTYSIEVQLRKSASMAYLPRVYLMASIGNPLAGATPVDTFTMTNSIDTWESDTFTVDNSAGDYDLDYALWFVGQNATGSVYSAYKLTPPSGGGGAVRILPFSGRVGL